MQIFASVRNQYILETFLDGSLFAAVGDPVAAREHRSLAIGMAKEAGIQDYHDDVHEPPQAFRPHRELLDSWLLGNGAEAIAAAWHELLASKRRRNNETFTGVKAMIAARCVKH